MKTAKTIVRKRYDSALHVIKSTKCLQNRDFPAVQEALLHVSPEAIIKRMNGVRGRQFKDSVLKSFVPQNRPLFG
jgi:hypothetical protein